MTVDANHDGKTDGEFFYTWTQPYTGTHGNDARSYREDRKELISFGRSTRGEREIGEKIGLAVSPDPC